MLIKLLKKSSLLIFSNLVFAEVRNEHFTEIFQKCMINVENDDHRMISYCNCTAENVVEKYKEAKTELDKLYISFDKVSTLRINDLCLNENFTDKNDIHSIFLLKMDQYLSTYISNKTNEHTPQGIKNILGQSQYGFIQYCINSTVLNKCNKISSLEFSYNCINNVFKVNWSLIQSNCINLSKKHNEFNYLQYLDLHI